MNFNFPFESFNYFDDDSVVDIDSFNLKYCPNLVQGNPNSGNQNIVDKYRNNVFTNKQNLSEKQTFIFNTGLNKNEHSHHAKIKKDTRENINISSNLIMSSSLVVYPKKKFSLKFYLKRIIDGMFSKERVKKAILNLIEKEKIDLQNLILFRKLKSSSKKGEYIECIVKIIFNLIKEN